MKKYLATLLFLFLSFTGRSLAYSQNIDYSVPQVFDSTVIPLATSTGTLSITSLDFYLSTDWNYVSHYYLYPRIVSASNPTGTGCIFTVDVFNIQGSTIPHAFHVDFSSCSVAAGELYSIDVSSYSFNPDILIWGNSSGDPYVVVNSSFPFAHIESLSVSTSTQKVNITGYWEATTTPNIFQQIEFYQDSTVLGIESYITENATSTGGFSFDFPYHSLPATSTGTTTAVISADTIFYANLYQFDNNYPHDPFTGIVDPRYKTTLDATSTTLTASTTTYVLNTTLDINDYPEYECSISSLTGCFKNAMVWTFYPSQQVISRFYSLLELIQSKPPIGYFSIIKQNISNISATSTPAFSVVIPAHLKSLIFDPFDTAIAVIIWIYFVFMFYKRLKHIQI